MESNNGRATATVPGHSENTVATASGSRVPRQARYWILTIPHHDYTPYLPRGIAWVKGQLELGESGYLHWQLCFSSASKISLARVRSIFGPHHAEPTRSSSAEEYVWKEDTYVCGTRFELGAKPFQRNNAEHWEKIWEQAKSGNLTAIDPQVRICHYRTLRAIRADYSNPVGMERTCFVFWGPTGTGKSRRAWELAGMDAYPKDPNSKFWCGYNGQEHVVVDEFRGSIGISHILRWLDRYPVNVEIKGSSVPLFATKLWFTSNIPPNQWYVDIDYQTRDALLRRLIVTEF